MTTPAPLSAAEVEQLLGFVGYGRLDAPTWFLGMEEGRSEDAARRLQCQLQLGQVADLRQAHLDVFQFMRFHGAQPKIQATWGTMCKIMLLLAGTEPTTDLVRHYQAHRLGRLDGETLLTELLPIASPNAGMWDYASLLPSFPDRRTYERLVLPRRVELLRGLIEQHRPRLLVCYGATHWDAYRRLFPGAVWKARPPFEVKQGTPTVILAHHFVPHRMGLATIKQLVAIATEA